MLLHMLLYKLLYLQPNMLRYKLLYLQPNMLPNMLSNMHNPYRGCKSKGGAAGKVAPAARLLRGLCAQRRGNVVDGKAHSGVKCAAGETDGAVFSGDKGEDDAEVDC